MARFISKLWNCVTINVVVVFIVQIACGANAPLPQRMISPVLVRNDCVEDITEDSFAPYIQEFLLTDEQLGVTLYSCINWWHGFLKSEGIGKERSRLAAELVAKSNALKTLLAANLNAQFLFQEYFERKNDAMLKIQNVLVQGAQVQELPGDPNKPDEMRVIATIPFYGITGLVSFFLDDQEIFLVPPQQTPEKKKPSLDVVTTEEYTGILIDARELSGVEPAVFPQVVSADGEILYTAAQVNREVLQTQGMVRYATKADVQMTERVGPHPLRITPILLASARPEQLFLAETKSRKNEGKQSEIVIKATGTTGKQPVNLVISAADAKKLKELHKKLKLDQQGKYLILIGREIAGTKGQYPESMWARREE